MLQKLMLAAALGAFVLAGPALAQSAAPPKAAAAKPAKKAAKRTCWDLAYESQAQKDCLAKQDSMKSAPAKPKAAKKSGAKKQA
jgi:hypothetical protein